MMPGYRLAFRMGLVTGLLTIPIAASAYGLGALLDTPRWPGAIASAVLWVVLSARTEFKEADR